jgi:predicted hydrocarbon binding protein
MPTTAADLFRHDPARGVVEAAGGRAMRVTEDFLAGLLEGLDGEVGDAAADVAYRCGYQWGVEDLQSFTTRARKQFETDVEKLPLGVALESWWAPLAAAGWGRWQYDFVQAKKGVILVDLRESAVAAAVGRAGRPVCHLYAGLYAACFTTLSKRKLAAAEIQCAAAGAESCKILVSTRKHLDKVAAWRRDGATAAEVVQRLSQGL